MWTGQRFHPTEFLARDLVREAEKAARLRNLFMINVMAVNVGAQYIEKF